MADLEKIWFGDLLRPHPAGGPIPQPSSILDANDIHITDVLAYGETGALIQASCKIVIPDAYVGSPEVGIAWKCIPTSGDMKWFVGVTAVADGESADPASAAEALTVVDTASGTTRLVNLATVTPTLTIAPGDFLYITIGRNSADGSDTLAGVAELIDAYFLGADA